MASNKIEFPFKSLLSLPFKTTSGSTCQIDFATKSGRIADTNPAPLAIAPLIARCAAPGYLSLPAINNVLPLVYLLVFFGNEGRLIVFKS